MNKFKLDISKAINEKVLVGYQNKVSKIHQDIIKGQGQGSDFLGWLNWPNDYDKAEVNKMVEVANKLLNKGVTIMVVIGIGGSYLGARAGNEMINGIFDRAENGMEILYAGNSISPTYLNQLEKYLKGKSWAINVVSKSGTTTEPAIAFTVLKAALETSFKDANERIVVTTDASKGTLIEVAHQEKYPAFVIPDNIGGRFSVLTPVGMFPLICSGADYKAIFSGAQDALTKNLANDDLTTNEAYRYATTRFHLFKNNDKYSNEFLVTYEPQMAMFGEWWKQLFAESEGKEHTGLLTSSATFSTDLHSLGQFIQEGSRCFFETVITVATPEKDIIIPKTEGDINKINYLTKFSMQEINQKAFNGVIDAHVSGGVKNIHIEIGKMDSYHFGYLVYFFELACAMSAYLLEVNPFNQPGVEVYKTNMFKLLGKKGY